MRSLFLLVVAVLLAGSASAQQWTSEQEEVITQLEECWDIWVVATHDGSPDAWIDSCTDDFRYRGDEIGAPNGVAELRRTWGEVVATDAYWVSLRPLDIRIIDDVAIVHFYGSWNEKQGEERVTQERQRTEVFHKEDGRWLLIAGHSQPSGN